MYGKKKWEMSDSVKMLYISKKKIDNDVIKMVDVMSVESEEIEGNKRERNKWER